MKWSKGSLRRQLRKSAPPVPQPLSDAYDRTLSSIGADRKRPAPHRILWGTIRAAACVLLLALLILPNISQSVAHAMQELPIIGSIVRVITVHKEFFEDDYHRKEVETPYVSDAGGTLGDAAGLINDDIESLTSAAIAQFEKECADLPDSHLELNINYEVLCNTEDWFTLELNVIRVAGSGSIQKYYYNIDKEKQRIVRLSDLFAPDFDYASVLLEEVVRQIDRQTAADGTASYWIGAASDGTIEFEGIRPDQNFYFDSENNLVLVFDKYEIAPGYMGTPEFPIPRALFQDHLQ